MKILGLQEFRKEATTVRLSSRRDKNFVMYVKFWFSKSLVKSRPSPRIYISTEKFKQKVFLV